MPLKNISVLSLFVVILATISGCAIEKRASQIPQESIVTTTPGGSYNRKDWPHWIDADRDCQNTRQEMLIAYSEIAVIFRNGKQCTVIAGKWFDEYTGNLYIKASDVDIDHIVPLAHAHRYGAYQWTRNQRRKFANDFENLLIVNDAINHSKGDQAPHQWLPPRKSYWCEYGRRWTHIKEKYQLWYNKEEQRFLNRMVEACR